MGVEEFSSLDFAVSLKNRIIARLDIKGKNLIKTVQLEGVRKIGDPEIYAEKYYKQGADELLYIDQVATLYGRNSLLGFIEKTTKNVFVPITVGGGIRTVEDIRLILQSGADKVAINTAAVLNPDFISKAANIFGSQCITLQLDVKSKTFDTWEVLTNGGREKTGLDALEWVKQSTRLGVGEILITSVDQEGTGKGFDCNLIDKISSCTDVPVVCSGGMGNLEHLSELYSNVKVSGIALSRLLHIEKMSIKEIKDYAQSIGMDIRG